MKTWVRVNRTAAGVTTVTVTVQEGFYVAKYSMRTFPTDLKRDTRECKKQALKHLALVKELEVTS